MKKLFLMIAALTSLSLVATACSDTEETNGLAGTPAEVHVTEAWARSPMADVGAVYFEAHNAGSKVDALVSATCDRAGRAEVHETTVVDGEMQMQPVEKVELPAGETFSFEPGGYHVMLFELTAPLVVGESITLTLTFENAGSVTVDAEVKEYVPAEGMAEEGGGGMG